MFESIGSFFKKVLHFFSAHTTELAEAATIAEIATGNAELVPLTQTIAKATQSSASILDKMTDDTNDKTK
jgi:hypothetical protein